MPITMMLPHDTHFVAVFIERPSSWPPEASIARLDCPARTSATTAGRIGQSTQEVIDRIRAMTAFVSVCRGAP